MTEIAFSGVHYLEFDCLLAVCTLINKCHIITSVAKYIVNRSVCIYKKCHNVDEEIFIPKAPKAFLSDFYAQKNSQQKVVSATK